MVSAARHLQGVGGGGAISGIIPKTARSPRCAKRIRATTAHQTLTGSATAAAHLLATRPPKNSRDMARIVTQCRNTLVLRKILPSRPQVQLGELQTALDIASETGGSEAKWKQLGELAMSSGRLDVRFFLTFFLSSFLPLMLCARASWCSWRGS